MYKMVPNKGLNPDAGIKMTVIHVRNRIYKSIKRINFYLMHVRRTESRDYLLIFPFFTAISLSFKNPHPTTIVIRKI